jgi:NADH-quinone oxidoreductase subunit L
MAIPLIVLAIGSVFAGYVGVPHALGGSNRLEAFLHPSFEPPAHARTLTTPGEAAGTVAEPAAAQRGEAAAHGDETRTEFILMLLSSAVAVAGIFIASYFWLRTPQAAAAVAQRFAPIYRLLYNKYYVDEIYDAVIVQPTKQISSSVLWKGFDAGLVDGTVNGVGHVVSLLSSVMRRLQTGSIRTYAASLILGSVLILAYYLWT